MAPISILSIPHNSTIIVGFSGGTDSVYLLLHLKQLEKSHNLTLIAAHLDHQWRPESGQDQIWCAQFCAQHQITYLTEKASNIVLQKKYNGSKEQHARLLRRAFFEKIAQSYQHAYIALAHHQDDQIETFFIRLARGTSLQGICGIKEHDGPYIRPILHVSKHEIMTYLKKHAIDFLHDATNDSPAFLRNRIRQQLLPTLTAIDERMKNHILDFMHHCTQTDALLQKITHETIAKLTCPDNPSNLNTKLFLEQPTIIQQRILLHLLIKAQAIFTPSQTLFEEIIRFLQASNKKMHTIHTTYCIIKNNDFFFIKQQ